MFTQLVSPIEPLIGADQFRIGAHSVPRRQRRLEPTADVQHLLMGIVFIHVLKERKICIRDLWLSRFHEDPMAIELLIRLQIITAVCPQDGLVGRHDGCARSARKTRDKLASLVDGRHGLCLL